MCTMHVDTMGEHLDSLLLRTLSRADRLWTPPSTSIALPTPAADGRLRTGDVVGGRYTIDRVLGEGAFGRVWRAADGTSGQQFALKELLPGGNDDDGGGGGGLAAEFTTLSRLKHPYIVGVHDYGELAGGARYLVMELVPGEDVFEKVKRGPLPRDEVLRVLLGLAQGLALLHARLFVHCDIKAENVRVTTKGDPKLMDFGLLHQLGTPAAAVQGTVAYMPPEMITGGVIDGRSDLYSFGVLAYEMFTGALPFDGESALDVMQQHLKATPKEPSYFLDLPREVDALVLSLLSKDARARPASAAAVAQTLSTLSGRALEPLPVSARTSYLYAASLVGRDAESKALDDVRTGLKEQRGAAVFLSGVGGEGKTRLLEEFRLRIKIDRALWAAGQCRKEGLAPLAPMVEALSTLEARTPDDVRQQFGATLSYVLPTLRAKGFSPPAFSNPQQAKLAVADAVAGWLRALSSTTSFVLCIEDLHWADGASLELLNHLVRALQGAPCVLFATFRSNEVERTSIVYSTIDERLAQHISLAGLQRGHVDELLQATLTEHRLAIPFVDELYATTRGNAFFLIEALRAFVEGGELVQNEGAWATAGEGVTIPADIDEVVRRRVKHLPAELLSLCRRLAPVGRALDPRLLNALVDVDAGTLAEQLDGLVERQYVVRQGAQYFFSHDTVRDRLYQDTDEGLRRAAHTRIAELLEKKVTGVAPSPSQLAHHYKRGTDRDHAIEFFLAAAREAAGKQQLLEATMMLNEGAELVDKSTRKDKQGLVVTFYDLLAATSVATHPPSCVKAVGRLLDVWKDVDPERVIAMMAAKKARIERTPKFLRRFVEEEPGPPKPFDPSTRDPILIFERLNQVSGMQAMALAVLGEAEAAIAAADRLVKRAPPGSPHVAVASVPKIVALFHMGRMNELRATAETATSIFERAGERLPPPLRIFWFLSLYFRALAEALAGTTAWEAPAKRAYELAERFDLPQEKGFALLPPLVRACLCGEPEAFSRAYADVEEITRRLGFPHVLNSRLRLWAPIYYLERGDRELARATSARLQGMAKATRDSWIATYASVFQGFEALADHDLARADELLQGACEGARAKKLGRLTTALCARAEVLAAQGRLDEARPIVDEALARATSPDTGTPYDEAVARRLAAVVDGTTDGALEHLRRALSVAEDMKNPMQQGLTAVALARTLRRADRVDDARGFLERARSTFGALGNQLQLQRVDEMERAA